jgi:hypothetical protein
VTFEAVFLEELRCVYGRDHAVLQRNSLDAQW